MKTPLYRMVARRAEAGGGPIGELERLWLRDGDRAVAVRMSVGAREAVARGAQPVVLVHGLVVSSLYFVPAALRLAVDYPVFVPDLPGFGHSFKPDRALTLAEQADTLEVIVDTLGLDRPVLVGNSLGAQYVVEHCLRHPERGGRLVLVGPTVDPAAPSFVGQGLRWLVNASREPLGELFVIARDLVLSGLVRPTQIFAEAIDDDLVGKLERVHCPTLVMRGSRDPIAPQRWAEEVVRRLPHGRLRVVEGLAHTLHYDQPAAFVEALVPFLEEAAGRERWSSNPF